MKNDGDSDDYHSFSSIQKDATKITTITVPQITLSLLHLPFPLYYMFLNLFYKCFEHNRYSHFFFIWINEQSNKWIESACWKCGETT